MLVLYNYLTKWGNEGVQWSTSGIYQTWHLIFCLLLKIYYIRYNGGKLLKSHRAKTCQNYYNWSLRGSVGKLGIPNLTVSKCIYALIWYAICTTKYFGGQGQRETHAEVRGLPPHIRTISLCSLAMWLKNLQLENIISLFVASIFSFSASMAAHLPWPGNGPNKGCTFYKSIVRNKEGARMGISIVYNNHWAIIAAKFQSQLQVEIEFC